mmetsp:Transcript_27237/g.27104  ORF Transcript_27237/g.27104 Transcript_27237/m.27104 type:complete len:100 (-) Transcript_27237:14-313(-)
MSRIQIANDMITLNRHYDQDDLEMSEFEKEVFTNLVKIAEGLHLPMPLNKQQKQSMEKLKQEVDKIVVKNTIENDTQTDLYLLAPFKGTKPPMKSVEGK